MKRLNKFVSALTVVAVVFSTFLGEAATAGKLNSAGEWTTSVTVKRGEAHTFWVDGLSPDTGVMSIDVEGRFTYKEDGDTEEDWVYNSESTDVQDESGNTTAIYALLTPDDWDVDYVPKSIKFTVTVSGFYDEDNSANNKFTFHHSEGDADYPEGYEHGGSEPAVPVGSDADHAESFLPKETGTPAAVATCGTVSKTLLAEFGNVYYLRSSSSLIAGRKYIFGLANSGKTTMKLTVKGGSVDLFENAKPYTNVWTDCSAAYEFIPDTTDVYTFELSGDSAYSFNFRHAVMPVRKPEEHNPVSLNADVASDEFAPGYLNNPKSGAYDSIIDDKLFKFTIPEKGDTYFFSTDNADSPLMMRLYDKNGTKKVENLSLGGGNNNVGVAWTASAKNEVVYVGVCQQLEDEEEPSAGPVTLIAEKVVLDTSAEALTVIPTTESDVSPFTIAGATPSSAKSLGKTAWRNTFTVAGRKDIEYNIKAQLAEGGNDNGLTIVADIYQLVNNRKVFLANLSDNIDPNSQSTSLPFTPTANGTVYIDVYVVDGEWGAGKGLEYGPYQVCVVASGDYGVLKVDMKGAPESKMAWKILKKDGASVKGEVFYPAGSTAILDAGDYTLAAQEVKGFAKPDATKGFGTYKIGVGATTPVMYKYTDTADPLDNLPDTKQKLNGKAYAPTKLDPKSGKPVVADRTLWDDDPADWYTVAAAQGCYYRLSFTTKDGAPKISVYGPGNWTDASTLDPAFPNDPTDALQFQATAKGTYYVKVAHANETGPVDSSYSLTASFANPGVVKIEKPSVSAKDSDAYVEIPVSRSAKDGVVRVKYRTEGAQSNADDAYYFPTNGVLRWEPNDSKAQKIRVRLVPNAGWATNKVVKVVLSTFSKDDETFDPLVEYIPQFAVDKQGKAIDTATITITASAKKAPGTIQVADCDTPKNPVFTVTAGEIAEIPFERILGADGIVGVKVETSKESANKSGETDYTSVTTNLVWNGGETDAKVVSVQTKTNATDYTAVKTFKLKLTALSSKKGDAVLYDKPTSVSSPVTVNIVNDKFAAAFDDYAKTVTDAANGYTVKEGKKGTWVVMADGSFYAPGKGDLTFTFKTTGTFKYTENGVAKTFTATAKDKTLKISGASTFSVDGYELDGTPVALRQGLKYSASFGTGGTIKASNLPAGLKLDQNKATKEWTVAGVPSKAGVFQATVGSSNICYTVVAEGTAAGTFNGLATTYDTTNGVPTLASVTITAALGGKLSASVNIAGKKYSFADTGYAYVMGDPADTNVPVYVAAELALVQKIGSGATAQTVTNWLYYTVMDVPETAAEGWRSEGVVEIQMAALPDAKGNGYQEDVWYSGKVYRDNSKSGKDAKAAWEAAMAKHAGYYTVSLVALDAMPGEPRGSGYITLTLDAKGKAKLAGKLADGTKYSSSATATLAGEEDDPSVRVPLYAQKGSWVFGGWLSIKADEDGVPVATIDSPDTDLVWKNDDPASTFDGEEGFSLYLQPVGGWYDTVSNLQRAYLESDLSVDLPEGEDALEEIMETLALGDGYAFVAQPSGQAVDLLGNTLSVVKQALVKTGSKKLIDWEKSVNASNVKITFKRATGIVSGTFDLWYEGTNAKGAVEQKSITSLKHEGVLVLSRGGEGYIENDVLSSGFFLVPLEIKYKDDKGKDQKRKWTGSYRFDIKATPVDRSWIDYTEE